MQRTWIALLEKHLPFGYHEVSLRNPETGLWYPLKEKPKWFTDLNPLGKVRAPCSRLFFVLYRWCECFRQHGSVTCAGRQRIQQPYDTVQVPTLAYESECEPEIQVVYESLICNEFLEVRVHRKATDLGRLH